MTRRFLIAVLSMIPQISKRTPSEMILPPFLLARWVREQPRRKTGKQTDVIQNAPASTIRNLLRWSTSMVDCTRDVEEQWLLQWSDSRGWRMHKEGHPKRDHSGELWKGGSEPMQVSSLSQSDDNHRESWRKNGTVKKTTTWAAIASLARWQERAVQRLFILRRPNATCADVCGNETAYRSGFCVLLHL